MPEFGFIFPRCVKSPTHNELWRENYRNMCSPFPAAPILIIDDHSDMALVDRAFSMTGATVIAPDIPPGKGEVLPYCYYFHKLRPFRKAVVHNDSMFILKPELMLRSAILSTLDFRCLWDFTYSQESNVEEQFSVLRPKLQDRLRELEPKYAEWAACFASISSMSWDFLDHLNATYGFLNMVDAIENRSHRMGLERLVGLVAVDAARITGPLSEASLYGSINAHRLAFTYSWFDYLCDRDNGALVDVPSRQSVDLAPPWAAKGHTWAIVGDAFYSSFSFSPCVRRVGVDAQF